MTGKQINWQSAQQFAKSNDYVIWFIAVVLSLSSHYIFFLQRQPLIEAPSTVIQETVTHVRFATISPAPVNVSEPEVITPRPEPVSPPEPVIIQDKPVEPLAKPAPEKRTIAKPVKQKKAVIKPRPEPIQKPVKPKPPTKERTPEANRRAMAQTAQNKKVTMVTPSPVVAKVDARLIEQTRMSYQALLMRHIEVHKKYPRVARKRNIQGKILVSFSVFTDGSIKNLQISGDKSILMKATRQAVNNALPMPKPPIDLSFPMEIKFTMNYSLK